jgi:DNA-binding IclR family transcriptional regulator
MPDSPVEITVGRTHAPKSPSVPSLIRGLRILELVARSRSGITLTQIARQLALPVSSVHLLLLTLEREEYLLKSAKTGRYVCATKLVAVARLSAAGILLSEQAARAGVSGHSGTILPRL